MAANIYLGQAPQARPCSSTGSGMIEGAADLLRDLRIRVPSVRVPVGTLSGGQRQGVAIARSVLRRAASSSWMSPPPPSAFVRRVTSRSIIAGAPCQWPRVILISHDLELVFRMADRIEVLRLGRVQGVRRKTDTTREEIVGLITGLLNEPGPVPSTPTPVAGPTA